MKDRIEEITTYLLPFLSHAGKYAAEIQKRIEHQPDKMNFSDPGSQALTDADLSIQNFFEIVLLAKYPELKFYGEEYLQSLNQKYFHGKDLEIWLDPIDGTLRYKKGQDQFSIIITFVQEGHIQACIWYMPALKKFAFGSSWSGVLEGTEEDALRGNLGNKISLNKDTKKILTYQLEDSYLETLSDFEMIDLSKVDSEEVRNLCPISFSEFSGLVASQAGVIDLLVGGHFLAWGGGVCTDLEGNPIESIDVRKTPSYLKGVVSATSETLHKEIMEKLGDS